jgi:hypothetical protein
MSAKFVMLANPHNNKPVLVNSDHVRTASESAPNVATLVRMVAYIRTSRGTLSPFGPSWRSGAASASRSAAPSRAPDAPLTRAPNVPLGVHELDLESEPRWTM